MNKGLKIAGCVVLGVLFVLGFGWITMTLWNWLIPSLFNGPVIGFWQALGLLILSKILFGGFGGRGHHKCGGHRGYSPWKSRMYEKFSNMNPEEREALKKKMRDRWCGYQKDSSGENPTGSND
jgi:hypothetical protein